MKLFLILFFATATVWAKSNSYKLSDEAILGLYQIDKKDKKSEIQSVELIYNNDNQLVVRTDRNESEYEVSGPDSSGVIYDGEDEPNCGGEEEQCWYDLQTVIKLGQVVVQGKSLPQLTIELTQANAWDEEGVDTFTTTFTFNWSRPLDYAIPFFLNIDNPQPLKELSESCNEKLAKIEFEDGAHYLNSNDICPFAFSVQLRDPWDKALDFYLKSEVSEKYLNQIQKLAPSEVASQIFDPARKLAQAYKPKIAGSPSSSEVIEQINLIEKFAKKGDVIYTYRYLRDSVIIVVDMKNKIISKFNVRVTDKYED